MRFLLALALILPVSRAYAQQTGSNAELPAASEPNQAALSDATIQQDQQPAPSSTSNSTSEAKQSDAKPADQAVPSSQQQPQRILGVMPNFRAVSAGEIPPLPTKKQSFLIATQNTFDYSSFVFVGFTSLFAEATDAHPQLHRGIAGYGRYYWRGFVDKADGNYLVIFALPAIFHQDERYFAMGHRGGIWKRTAYSASRIVITPNYDGHNTFNASELLGRAMAQGISAAYYPSGARTLGALATRYGYALMRDAITNTFREFWPDIAVHVLHRHP